MSKMKKTSPSNIQELMAFDNNESFSSDKNLTLPLPHTNINPQTLHPSISPNYVHQDEETLLISETLLDSSAPSSSHKNKSLVISKRKRKSDRLEGEEKKPIYVIHVKAKRGQATDSHSLAERVRREKINEKLRCLQELVPGCFKFLSMKLTTATMHYDFHASESINVTETFQVLQRNNAPSTWQVQEMEKMGEEESVDENDGGSEKEYLQRAFQKLKYSYNFERSVLVMLENYFWWRLLIASNSVMSSKQDE